MKQIIDDNFEDSGRRLDAVRKTLSKPNLSKWARGYWTAVEKALIRQWKSRVLGVKIRKESMTYAD